MQLKAQGVEAHKEREFEDATGYFKQVLANVFSVLAFTYTRTDCCVMTWSSGTEYAGH